MKIEQRYLQTSPFYPACLKAAERYVCFCLGGKHTFITLATTLLSVSEFKHRLPTQKLAEMCAVQEPFVENLQYVSACANTKMKLL